MRVRGCPVTVADDGRVEEVTLSCLLTTVGEEAILSLLLLMV